MYKDTEAWGLGAWGLGSSRKGSLGQGSSENIIGILGPFLAIIKDNFEQHTVKRVYLRGWGTKEIC